jgi:hypothetical protein
MAMEAEQTGQLPIERAWPEKKESFFLSGISLCCLLSTSKGNSVLLSKYIAKFLKIFQAKENFQLVIGYSVFGAQILYIEFSLLKNVFGLFGQQ